LGRQNLAAREKGLLTATADRLILGSTKNLQEYRLPDYVVNSDPDVSEEKMSSIIPLITGPRPAPRGYRWVFCKSFIHWRSKKPVFRKNGGMFCFLVRAA
jgi:hypothetical protein